MRIVTRPDFDGVVCAVLISDALDIHLPVQWLEPNAFQKGLADIRAGDIVANLPFHPNCELWFDHHATNTADRPFQGLFWEAPSAASLVLEYFKPRLKRDYTELVHWADRVDSADFTQGMVLHPEKYDYVLLSMTVSGEDGDGEPYWNRLVSVAPGEIHAGGHGRPASGRALPHGGGAERALRGCVGSPYAR